MTTEQSLVTSWRSLSEEAQRAALNFVQALQQKQKFTAGSNDIKRQLPPPELVGQVKITGDIVSPLIDAEDCECLK